MLLHLAALTVELSEVGAEKTWDCLFSFVSEVVLTAEDKHKAKKVNF